MQNQLEGVGNRVLLGGFFMRSLLDDECGDCPPRVLNDRGDCAIYP